MTSKMRCAQLRELCEEKGLDCVGLKKADMLALLKQREADEAMTAAAADDGESGSDEEVTVDGAAGAGRAIIRMLAALMIARP